MCDFPYGKPIYMDIATYNAAANQEKAMKKEIEPQNFALSVLLLPLGCQQNTLKTQIQRASQIKAQWKECRSQIRTLELSIAQLRAALKKLGYKFDAK